MQARKDVDWSTAWGGIDPSEDEQVSLEAALAWQQSVRFLFDACCQFAQKPPEDVWLEVRAVIESYTGEDRCMPDDIDWVGAIVQREVEVDVISGTRVAKRYKTKTPLIDALGTVLGRYKI